MHGHLHDAVGHFIILADHRIAARLVAPIELDVGTNTVTIDLPGRDLAFPGPYSLDLMLLDTNWAAIPIDGAENVATIPN